MATLFSVERTIAWGFAASLFGMIALALVAYSVSKEEMESANWVASTEEIISTLQEIQRIALDAESTGRAFVISGTPDLIDEYEKLNPLIAGKIAELRELAGNNGEQRQFADKLLEAVNLRFAGLTRVIERRRTEKFQTIVEESARGKGRAQMNIVKAMIGEMVAKEERLLKQQKRMRDKTVRIVWATIVATMALGGSVLTWIFYHTIMAVRQRKQAEERANHLAHHDALSGLPNRRMLEDRLLQAMAAATRHGHLLGILYLDLDGFKKINDTLGHDIGDELLKEVARRLQATLREEDTAARFGGDEFVVALMHLKKRADAEAAARKLVDALAIPYLLSGYEVSVTTSVGISVFPETGKTKDELLKHADAALYEAKRAGKNRYYFFPGKADITVKVA
jgi:diguanylate cyclase (GGDEF)-like protein